MHEYDDMREGYTKPELRQRILERIKAGDKGGAPGQWSARKAQMVAQEYERQGGGYTGKKSDAQKSLVRWTKQEWTTKSGKPSTQGPDATGERYLPKKQIERMSDEDYRKTSAAKRKGWKQGKQFVPQPASITEGVIKAPKGEKLVRGAGGKMGFWRKIRGHSVFMVPGESFTDTINAYEAKYGKLPGPVRQAEAKAATGSYGRGFSSSDIGRYKGKAKTLLAQSWAKKNGWTYGKTDSGAESVGRGGTVLVRDAGGDSWTAITMNRPYGTRIVGTAATLDDAAAMAAQSLRGVRARRTRIDEMTDDQLRDYITNPEVYRPPHIEALENAADQLAYRGYADEAKKLLAQGREKYLSAMKPDGISMAEYKKRIDYLMSTNGMYMGDAMRQVKNDLRGSSAKTHKWRFERFGGGYKPGDAYFGYASGVTVQVVKSPAGVWKATVWGTKFSATGKTKNKAADAAAHAHRMNKPLEEASVNGKGKCSCWNGYERVPGTKPCAPGSCRKCDHMRKTKRLIDTVTESTLTEGIIRAPKGEKLVKGPGGMGFWRTVRGHSVFMIPGKSFTETMDKYEAKYGKLPGPVRQAQAKAMTGSYKRSGMNQEMRRRGSKPGSQQIEMGDPKNLPSPGEDLQKWAKDSGWKYSKNGDIERMEWNGASITRKGDGAWRISLFQPPFATAFIGQNKDAGKAIERAVAATRNPDDYKWSGPGTKDGKRLRGGLLGERRVSDVRGVGKGIARRIMRDNSSDPKWRKRVQELEDEGLSTSDAQSAADVEWSKKGAKSTGSGDPVVDYWEQTRDTKRIAQLLGRKSEDEKKPSKGTPPPPQAKDTSDKDFRKSVRVAAKAEAPGWYPRTGKSGEYGLSKGEWEITKESDGKWLVHRWAGDIHWRHDKHETLSGAVGQARSLAKEYGRPLKEGGSYGYDKPHSDKKKHKKHKKAPKGYHRMPDGSLMKDEDHSSEVTEGHYRGGILGDNAKGSQKMMNDYRHAGMSHSGKKGKDGFGEPNAMREKLKKHMHDKMKSMSITGQAGALANAKGTGADVGSTLMGKKPMREADTGDWLTDV